MTTRASARIGRAAAALAALVWVLVPGARGPREGIPARAAPAGAESMSAAELPEPERHAVRSAARAPITAEGPSVADVASVTHASAPADPAPFLLHVHDAETGIALSGLEVRTTPRSRRGGGPTRAQQMPLLTASGSSPIALAGSGAQLQVNVRSPYHPWGTILVVTAPGAEALLDLHPGGQVEVRFVGGEPASGSLIELVPSDRPGRAQIIPTLFGSSRADLGSQRFGTWKASLLGPSGDRFHALLAERTFVHEESSTVVEIEFWPSGSLARLAGTLRAPGWRAEEGPLILRQVRVVRSAAGRSGPTEIRPPVSVESEDMPWDCGDVEPGWWSASFGQRELARFELRPPGFIDLHLEVAPVTEVEVLLQESGVHVDASARFCLVLEPLAEGLRSLGIGLEPTATPGRFVARAPSGRASFFANAQFVFEPMEVLLLPGSHSVAVRARAPERLLLRLLDHGAPVTGITEDWFQLERPGGWILRSAFRNDAGEARVSLSHAGLWTVQLSDRAGYEKVPLREVRIEPGVEAVLELELSPYRKLRQ